MKIRFANLLLLLSAASFSLSSCSDDDDPAGPKRLATISESGRIAGESAQYQYTYDSKGRVSTLKRVDTGVVHEADTTCHFTYDDAQCKLTAVTLVEKRQGESSPSSSQVEFNESQDITSTKVTDDLTFTYSYVSGFLDRVVCSDGRSSVVAWSGANPSVIVTYGKSGTQSVTELGYDEKSPANKVGLGLGCIVDIGWRLVDSKYVTASQRLGKAPELLPSSYTVDETEVKLIWTMTQDGYPSKLSAQRQTPNGISSCNYEFWWR